MEVAVKVPVPGGQPAPAWENYPLGVAEALRQRLQRQQVYDSVEDILDVLKEVLDQFNGLLKPPAALPDKTEAEQPPETAPLVSVISENRPDDPAPHQPAEQPAFAASVPADAEGFACAELLPTTAAPPFLPAGGESDPQATLDLRLAVLAAWLARCTEPRSLAPRAAAT